MPPPRAQKFEAEVVVGHKGVHVVIVPFDPEEAFARKPVRLAGRRHGWLIDGTLNGVAFDGYIGERWGRFFVALDAELREQADVGAGDIAAVVLRASDSPATFARALEQSKATTQPTKARADALDGPRAR